MKRCAVNLCFTILFVVFIVIKGSGTSSNGHSKVLSKRDVCKTERDHNYEKTFDAILECISQNDEDLKNLVKSMIYLKPFLRKKSKLNSKLIFLEQFADTDILEIIDKAKREKKRKNKMCMPKGTKHVCNQCRRKHDRNKLKCTRRKNPCQRFNSKSCAKKELCENDGACGCQNDRDSTNDDERRYCKNCKDTEDLNQELCSKNTTETTDKSRENCLTTNPRNEQESSDVNGTVCDKNQENILAMPLIHLINIVDTCSNKSDAEPKPHLEEEMEDTEESHEKCTTTLDKECHNRTGIVHPHGFSESKEGNEKDILRLERQSSNATESEDTNKTSEISTSNKNNTETTEKKDELRNKNLPKEKPGYRLFCAEPILISEEENDESKEGTEMDVCQADFLPIQIPWSYRPFQHYVPQHYAPFITNPHQNSPTQNLPPQQDYHDMTQIPTTWYNPGYQKSTVFKDSSTIESPNSLITSNYFSKSEVMYG